MAGGFNFNTRRKIIQLPTQTKPTGGGTTEIQLPKTGLLSKIYGHVSVTVTGTVGNVSALGASAFLRRIRLIANSGLDLFNVSGPGFSYLLTETLGSEYFIAQGQNQGRTAITATTFILPFVIPLSINDRDPLGMVMLQNEQTTLTLAIDWAADSSVMDGGATYTGTCIPYLELFTVPVDPADWPPLTIAHQILEDQQAVSAAGQFVYNWPRGNTYLQVLHGLGIGVSGSDLFTLFQVRVNQSDYLQSTAVTYLDQEHRWLRGRARPSGGIYVDLMGTTGLGNFGSTRDLFNSALVTDLASVITASNSGTLYSVRRQLVSLS